MKAMVWLAALAAGLLAGCVPVAHVELEDGSLVSFVMPKAVLEGKAVPGQEPPCDATRDVGLRGVMHVVPDPEAADQVPPNAGRLVFELQNVSQRPIRLKRLFAYGFAAAVEGAEPPTVSPESGFTIPCATNKPPVLLAAETAGVEQRLAPLPQRWALNGETLTQAFFHAGEMKPSALALTLSPEALRAAKPGARAQLRLLGGDRVLAECPVGPDAALRFEGVPPWCALEVSLPVDPARLPTAPGRLFLEDKDGPSHALMLGKTLDRELRPGERLTFAVRFANLSSL